VIADSRGGVGKKKASRRRRELAKEKEVLSIVFLGEMRGWRKENF